MRTSKSERTDRRIQRRSSAPNRMGLGWANLTQNGARHLQERPECDVRDAQAATGSRDVSRAGADARLVIETLRRLVAPALAVLRAVRARPRPACTAAPTRRRWLAARSRGQPTARPQSQLNPVAVFVTRGGRRESRVRDAGRVRHLRVRSRKLASRACCLRAGGHPCAAVQRGGVGLVIRMSGVSPCTTSTDRGGARRPASVSPFSRCDAT